MQTSTIRHRVADFLKQHPPFHFLEESDLLELAGSGRVRFHEGDEILFSQGGQHKPHVWVIHRGSVRLYEESAAGPVLRDVLGVGQLLGVGRFVGAESYLYGAKTVGDVLLYAFPVASFEGLVQKHDAVRRYLSANFSVRSDVDDRPRRSDEKGALAVLAAHRLLTCRPGTTVRDAAVAMRKHDADAVVLADEEGRPNGIVTLKQMRDRLTESGISPDDKLDDLASKALRVSQAGLPMEAYQLEMMGAPEGRLVLTLDGDAGTAATGLLSATDLSLLIGINPALLALEAERAESASDLAPLVSRGKALAAQVLVDHRRAAWAAHVAGELNAAVLRRLVVLAERELDKTEPSPPPFRRCYLFLGAAGRRELLTWVDLDVAVVFEDLPEAEREAAAAWLGQVGERVDAALLACGFRYTESGKRLTMPDMRLSTREWRERFHGWINAPLDNPIYPARPCFDFRAAAGDVELADELRSHVLAEIAGNPGFLQLLANDCLANLPPLTFFEGLVVEEGGEESDTLDLRRAALFPIVDAARVFGLRYAEQEPGTYQRLEAAAREDTAHAELFAAAREAYRIALAHRGRQGLEAGDDGSSISPSRLSKVDQQTLKGAFRTIVELLRHTRQAFELGSED